ncbi:unannotated protein [freshwater metagenome]|uniref:Unannotated protein n=1 Tax=freshwater metagenome TaxID=449393 RepID=A0A6J7FVN7_9ZZZZ
MIVQSVERLAGSQSTIRGCIEEAGDDLETLCATLTEEFGGAEDGKRRAAHRLGTAQWFERSPGRDLSLVAEVDEALQAIGTWATKLAASVVSDQYMIVAALGPPGADPVEIILRDRFTGHEWAADGVGKGLSLWVELALHESSRRAVAHAIHLEGQAHDLGSDLFEVLHCWDPPIHPSLQEEDEAATGDGPQALGPGTLTSDIFEEAMRLEDLSTRSEARWGAEAIKRLHRSALDAYVPAADALRRSVEALPRAVPAGVGADLLLVDEPERHLHPARQAEMTGWLLDLARDNGSRILAVTHAPAALTQREGVAHSQVFRDDHGASHIADLRPVELTPWSPLSKSMGLDRGGLYAPWCRAVFVEGRHDVEVLESFAGQELRAAGVLTRPTHGTKNLRPALEAWLESQQGGIPVAVLIDGLDADDISALRAGDTLPGSEARRRALAAEIEAVRRVTEVERRFEVRIPIVGIGVRDIFYALPDELVQACFPRYKGYSSIRQRVVEARDHKTVLSKLGIDIAAGARATFGRLLDEHARGGYARTPTLENVVEALLYLDDA